MADHPSGWTREKPTVPGWYWWRPEDNGLNPIVCWVSSDGIALFINFAPSMVRDMPGEWLGPLTPEQFIEWAQGKCA